MPAAHDLGELHRCLILLGLLAAAEQESAEHDEPAPADDDSINLIKLVGPAILKRAIPVAIALGGLVVLGRLLFRRREKPEMD